MKDCKLKHYKPLCHTGEGLLLYRREKLYLLEEETGKLTFVCNLPIEDSRGLFCFSHFTTRLMHIYAYCGAEVPGGAVVAFNRGVYYVEFAQKTALREHDFAPRDMRRPFGFYEVRGVSGFTDGLYYGEYSYNADGHEVGIYRREGSGAWRKCYAFSAGTIRHIHSIIPDPYRGRVIVCTGDSNGQSGIWAAYDDFARVERLLGGEQRFRVCCARAYPEGVVAATDSPHFQNYAYLLEEADGRARLKELCALPGPTVFFTYYGDEVAFATDVEYDERILNGFTKYFTYHRGPGVQDWYAHLFIGNPSKGFREVLKLRKDIFPMGAALGFGGISFPSGQYPGRLYFYPAGVRKNEHLCYLDAEDFRAVGFREEELA